MSAEPRSHPRSGPFAWSSFGSGYLVACYDDGGVPVIDVVLPQGPGDGVLVSVATLTVADATALATRLAELADTDRPALWMLPDVRDQLAALESAVWEWDLGRREGVVPDPAPGAGAGTAEAGARAALEAVDALLHRLYELRAELSESTRQESVGAVAPGGRRPVQAGPPQLASPDRKLTTMGGLALALGIVAVFWIVVGVVLWILFR